ncbi:MAG: ribosome maturation factor RimM [Candidatus Aminicenantes bacterium]
MKEDNLVSIGRIAKARGVKGELKIHPFIHSPEPLFLSKVFIKKRNSIEKYRVESLRAAKDYFLLKLEGVNSIEEAGLLAGAEVLVPESVLFPTEPGEYYHFQLIGCAVLTVEGSEAGEVTGIIPAGGNDLLQVRQDQREVLIPFSENICVEVDIPGKRIIIDPPEGLLDLNEV